MVPMAVTGKRLEKAMENRGFDQSGLARAVGVSQATINRIVLGKTANSRLLPRIATELGVSLPWLLGMSDDAGQLPAPLTLNDDDEVEVEMLDLAYGMGGAFLDTHIEIEKKRFPLSWLRRYTDSPAHLLAFARGVGDSMWPTIHDQDDVLIDRGKTRLEDELADRIWCAVFGDIGMIKRLRRLPNGTVKIMSDNPQVSDEIAADGELHIIGRIVWKGGSV